ncbi:hypothetical protein AB0M41_19570 [Streptomyces sp. NPDC051896]|uniref:hypothetical protein n=1 Tax=Streptomyces sp. NPDC051896 TaxID=3155416 RepID=UPI003415E869
MILAQPAAGTAGARIRHSVRASVLVAVLLGLFLMHGRPAAAAGGCHGAMPATDAAVMSSADAPMAAHPAGHVGATGGKVTAHADEMRSAPAIPAGHSTGHPAAATAAAAAKATPHADEAMRGALCLATTNRSGIPAPPLAVVGLVFPAAVLLPWTRPGSDGTRRRGPPAGGRRLLLQVCVART